MTDVEEDRRSDPKQNIAATQGAKIQNVIQAVVSGQVTGDVHIGDKVYTRSALEELNDYLARAVSAFETRMYQLIIHPATSDQPYKFLYPFDIKDADIFFGRNTTSEALHRTVLKDRLTIFHARSGAGKTSLLKAGLSPRLIREGRLPVYARIHAYEENPTMAVKRAIVPPSLGPWPELLPDLSLQELLGLACVHLSRETQELVVFFDQFEEFLISLPEPDLRLPFIEALRDCYEDQSLPVRFMIALKRENLGDLDEFQDLLPDILHNRYALPAMTQAELTKAITGPVLQLQTGVSFEPALLETLLADLGGKGTELPHLQIVCTKLYQSLPQGEKLITVGLYQSLGKTEKILTAYLKDMLSQLPSPKQPAARHVLKELVTSTATSRILSLDTLAKQIPPDPTLLEGVLEDLVKARLLRLDDSTGEKEYELAHAYLAKEIITWVDSDELKVKDVQELLQQEVVHWRAYKTLLDEDRLNILRTHIKYLYLNNEAQNLLFNSALARGHNIGFWIEQVDDKRNAIQQLARCLVDSRRLRKKLASDLKSNLEESLRPSLLSTLWTMFEQAGSAARRDAARVLWIFRAWLSIGEMLRVMIVLGPVWAMQSLPWIVVLIVLFLGGLRIWTFLTREHAIPGNWLSIPAGDFVMGLDEAEARFAQTLCLEGKVLDKDDCREPKQEIEWAGRQTDAWLPTFHLMDNEVTNAQYKQCFDDSFCQVSDQWEYDKNHPNKPATHVSWTEAMTFCLWLGGRLPTEGEWEKAARGPGGNYFPWGDDWDSSKANIEHLASGNVEAVTTYSERDISYYGIKNMAGNVREWTASRGSSLPIDSKFFNDVIVPAKADENVPVILRGGSWKNERSLAMGSSRGADSISMSRATTGFRCVCSTDQTCKVPWTWGWIWFGQY